MFSSFSFTLFGLELKRIRKNLGLTQVDVSGLSNINCDTLRRIENGLVIPKYETLEILSYFYKTDLLSIIQKYRTHSSFYEFYNLLNKAIMLDAPEQLFNLRKQLKELIENFTNELVLKVQLDQISLFLEALLLYYSDIEDNYNKSILLLTQLISLTHKEFSLTQKKGITFNEIEGRALLYIALNLIKQEKISESNDLLMRLVNNSMNTNYSSNYQSEILIKIYLNISYNFHRLDFHWNSLLYALKGINICNQLNSNFCLPQLLGRKGIAEYHLNLSSYKKTLTECLTLFNIIGCYEMSKKYRKICLEKYNIII